MSANPQLVNQYGQPVYIDPTGLQPNPLNQPAYGQPYPPPPPPPVYVQSQPTAVVFVQDYTRELPCPMCGRGTPTIPIRKPGGVTWLWCCCLLWFTGICCFLPFLIDSCQDVHLVCMQCNMVKQIIPANCC